MDETTAVNNQEKGKPNLPVSAKEWYTMDRKTSREFIAIAGEAQNIFSEAVRSK